MDNQLTLMRQPLTQSLPAGVLGQTAEIFTTGDENYAIINGFTEAFAKWPEWLKQELLQELKSDLRALKALIELGINDELQMIWQFARCRRGSYDSLPDIVNGELVHTEYLNCGIRGNCSAEGKLCINMKMPGGMITATEMRVWHYLTKGLLDKEIADRLNMSPKTVPQHVRSLCHKCQVRNRTELTALGVRLNIG